MFEPLRDFHPAVRTWFERRFAEGPTEPQAQGWPRIREREDTLIAAPTGSGKTLSAFLVCIDELYHAAERGELTDATRVVYVSPLKALAVDIQKNLEIPLTEIRQVAEELGLSAPDIRTAVRSGDTTAKTRASLLKKPPHILITTPESLYLMVTAERSRQLLGGVRTVIVDEIHAVARDKRGAHLALTLERLEHVASQAPTTAGKLQRIGLSATQRPLSIVARLLVGAGRCDVDGVPRCAIVDSGHKRHLDLAIELPADELEAVASHEQIAQVLDRIAEHVVQRRTTLVFVNTRRLAERLAHQLTERLGADKVAAHHGSLSKDRRWAVEERLRSGQLAVLVATASLELGIDIGPVELVCQIGSPRSIATFLQRVGRSGHTRHATPVGRLYPLTRDELVECAALLASVSQGHLDAIVPSVAPTDILAQQLIAECAAEEWTEDALFALVRRAAPFGDLARSQFEEILQLVSEGVVTGRGQRGAYVHRDRINQRLKGRRGARLVALTSGGAIPETADYRVLADPDDTLVGTINEDFAIESMAGDVFLLGSTSWRIRRVERGVVRVVDAQGASPTIPFWLGEAPARTPELSAQVASIRAAVELNLGQAAATQTNSAQDNNSNAHATAAAVRWLADECSLDHDAARAVVEYLAASHAQLGVLPTQTDLVFERFFDESGGMQLVVHAPFGGRINRALGLLLRKRFCRSFDFELQAAASDDSILLSLGPQHSFPLEDLQEMLSAYGVAKALEQAVLPTPMFGVRWRWNLNRFLLVPRFKGGKRNPPPLQRMEADDLMAAIFPSLAACQDNATGPRVVPDHPVVAQTLRDCMTEAMDLAGLHALLGRIAAGTVKLHVRDTTEPSPLAHEILNSRPYTFLDDAPLEERRARAVQIRRGLPVHARDLAELDAAAIDRVRAEATPEPRDADELFDLLWSCLVRRAEPAWATEFAHLVETGRAATVHTARGDLWCCVEQAPQVKRLWGDVRFSPEIRFSDRLPQLNARAEPALPELDTLAAHALRGHLETSGPRTVADLSADIALDASLIERGLALLEREGSALRGHFDPRLDSSVRSSTQADSALTSTVRGVGVTRRAEEQWCSRRLLSRIHAYTRERQRREIEPVTAQDLMRFLFRWQHVAPDSRLAGKGGVLAVISQLQGFELAVAAWEPEILACRVEKYQGAWLDALSLAGQVAWARLSVRRLEPIRGANLSRATPITMAVRADLPWLLSAARGERSPIPSETSNAARVIDALQTRGAMFLPDITAATHLLPAEVQDALWDGVARGLVNADGFHALRELQVPSRSRRPRERGGAYGLRRGLRQGANGLPATEGRWALLAAPVTDGDADELAEAVAEQLLARWGVVFRDLLARESLGVPWRDVIWALRRLEARGVVRGGRFVSGFVGEQYALPEAVELLRATRATERSGEVVRISACDPLNLVGIIVPGARVAPHRSATVVYRDGLPLTDALPSALSALRKG